MSVGTITTEAELAALPERTAVVDRMGDVGTVLGGMLRYPETTPQSFERAAKKYGPFHIVYSPPAPEPEPEFVPGNVYDIETTRGVQARAVYTEAGYFSASDDGSYSAEDVEGADALVVIDPAAVDVEALVEVAHHDRVLYGDTTPDQMRRAILRILAHMGIEAIS